MKLIIIVTVFHFLFSFSVFGQSEDEKAIRQVLNDIATVNKTADFTMLERIFADDFIFISAQGKTFSKTERISFVKSVPPPEFFEYKNEKIRIYGNTAIVNAEVNLIPSGKTAETHIVTIVMLKTGDRWREINVQATRKLTPGSAPNP
jgi:ketosteroid isomerase-like protein